MFQPLAGKAHADWRCCSAAARQHRHRRNGAERDVPPRRDQRSLRPTQWRRAAQYFFMRSETALRAAADMRYTFMNASAELWTRRVVHDDRFAVRERSDGVARVARDDRYSTRSADLGNAVNGYLELTLDHFVYFFLHMGVLVDRRTAHEMVMRDGHVRGMKVATVPARQTFDDLQRRDVDERHGILRASYHKRRRWHSSCCWNIMGRLDSMFQRWAGRGLEGCFAAARQRRGQRQRCRAAASTIPRRRSQRSLRLSAMLLRHSRLCRGLLP